MILETRELERFSRIAPGERRVVYDPLICMFCFQVFTDQDNGSWVSYITADAHTFLSMSEEFKMQLVIRNLP